MRFTSATINTHHVLVNVGVSDDARIVILATLTAKATS